jgi:hypothetical protein
MFNGDPYLNTEYARIHHQELIKEAENYHLVAQETRVQENPCIQHYRFYQKALLKLGERMVSWGINLQSRYTDEQEGYNLAIYRQREAFEK